MAGFGLVQDPTDSGWLFLENIGLRRAKSEPFDHFHYQGPDFVWHRWPKFNLFIHPVLIRVTFFRSL
jgi:hypothetical protein